MIIKDACRPSGMSCAPACSRRRQMSWRAVLSPRSPNCSRPGGSPTEFGPLDSTCSAIFSISLRPPPAISSTAGSKVRRLRPHSASTVSSAIMRAPTDVVATTGDGDLDDGDALGVCDSFDRVNEGKVSAKILNFESAGSKRKSPCAPLSFDRSRSHRGACRAVTRHH